MRNLICKLAFSASPPVFKFYIILIIIDNIILLRIRLVDLRVETRVR